MSSSAALEVATMSAIAAAYGKHQLQERVNFFHFFLMGSASLEWNT